MKTGFRLALGTIALLTVACGSNNESLFGPSGADEDAELSPGFAPFTPGVCAAPASLRSAAGARSCAASGHGGRAKVVQANVLGVVQATVVDSGDLPASGGSRHDALLKVGVAPILHAEAATASVVGQGSETSARAEVAKVEAKLLGIGISADVIDARAEARCTSSGVGRSGESRIAALRVGGLAIQVTGAPNQTLEINGILRVVINEQISWADGIRVNALHVTALGSLKVADLIVSSAEARIACSASCQSGGGSGCGGASCGGGSNGSDGSGGSNGGGSSGGGSNGGGSSGGGSSGGGSNGGGASGGGSSGGGANGGGSNGGATAATARTVGRRQRLGGQLRWQRGRWDRRLGKQRRRSRGLGLVRGLGWCRRRNRRLRFFRRFGWCGRWSRRLWLLRGHGWRGRRNRRLRLRGPRRRKRIGLRRQRLRQRCWKRLGIWERGRRVR